MVLVLVLVCLIVAVDLCTFVNESAAVIDTCVVGLCLMSDEDSACSRFPQICLRTMAPKPVKPCKRPQQEVVEDFKVPAMDLGCDPDRVFKCLHSRQVWPCMACSDGCRPWDCIKYGGGIKHEVGICGCRSTNYGMRGQGRHKKNISPEEVVVRSFQRRLASIEQRSAAFEEKVLERRAEFKQELDEATTDLAKVEKDPLSHHACRGPESILRVPDARAHWTLIGRMSLPPDTFGFSCDIELDKELMRSFYNKAAVRIAAWGEYVEHKNSDAEFFQSVMTRSGIPPAFLSSKSGMPFQALNKESVLWINLLQGRVGPTGVSPETIVNSLLCIVLYRGWFNSYERWVAFEKEFDLKDGELLCNNFGVDRFVAAATCDAVEIEGRRRGGAYNPGTYGIAWGVFRKNVWPSVWSQ